MKAQNIFRYFKKYNFYHYFTTKVLMQVIKQELFLNESNFSSFFYNGILVEFLQQLLF